MNAGTKTGTEAEREWGALALAALGAGLAGLAVSTVTDPWYLKAAIAAAAVVFLVAAGMFLVTGRHRRRHDPEL
jgi:hypothetical protein